MEDVTGGGDGDWGCNVKNHAIKHYSAFHLKPYHVTRKVPQIIQNIFASLFLSPNSYYNR